MVKSLLTLVLACATMVASAQTLEVMPKSRKVNSATVERLSPLSNQFQSLQAPASRVGSGALKSPASRAESLSMTYSLCSEPYNARALQNQKAGNEVWCAIEMDEETVNLFATNKITALNIANPTNNSYVNPISEVTLFITEDLEGTPLYTQKGTLGSEGFEWSKVTLDTPYTLEKGKPVFLGFYVTLAASDISGVYYIITDDIPTENLSAGYIKYTNGNGATVVENVAQSLGGICITADLEGENLPRNIVTPEYIIAPVGVEQNASAPIQIAFTNNAANSVTSFGVELTFGDDVATYELTAQEPIGYGKTIGGTINYTPAKSSLNVPVSFRVVTLDGNANQEANLRESDYTNVLPTGTGYPRMVVLEEGTGTWCGWCPLGFEVMKYVRSSYAGKMIPVALHASDEMMCNDLIPVLNKYFGSYPTAVASRSAMHQTGFSTNLSTNKSYIDQIYNDLAGIKAVADLSVVATYTDDSKTTLNIDATTTGAISGDATLALSFILVEDNIGPYNQENYLSGYPAIQIPGYASYGKLGETFSTTYDDVARYALGSLGIEGSVPASITAGTPYKYTTTMPLNDCKAANTRLVAYLLNTLTGRIENACEVPLSDIAGISEVTDDAQTPVSVKGVAGGIAIEGVTTTATVYSTSGTCVATTPNGTVALPAGIYVVKADGVVAKVAVK